MRLPRRRPLLATGLALALATPLLTALSAQPVAATDQQAPDRLAARPAFVTAGTALGFDRLTLRRGGSWLLRDSLDGGPATRVYSEQVPGWQPVAGDTNGDGEDSLSLFKDGVWLLREQAGGPARRVVFGQRGDTPVMGDWNGDGVDSMGLFRGGRWYLRNSNSGGPSLQFGFGAPKDQAVVGDWDGNGRTDIAVRRGTVWYQRDAVSGGLSHRRFAFGNSGDLPVAGDWDHDGRDTPGVFRAGAWYLRRLNGPSPYQTVFFGQAGDRPVLRRTQGLAPGVTHQSLGDPSAPWSGHLLTVDLAAASSIDLALSGNRLAGTERVATMTRRAGAVAGVNGDFFLGSGRPVHLYAEDGRLIQTPSTLGRAFGLDLTGTQFSMGYPDVKATLTTSGATGTVSLELPRVNQGAPIGESAAGYTAAAASLETPPDDYCYVGLSLAGSRSVQADGRVQSPLTVTGSPRCGGPRPVVPETGTVVAADPFQRGAEVLRGLGKDQSVRLDAQLGFPGAVDAMGGNPLLVVNGIVPPGQVDGTDPFFSPAPRTAVGVTADGKLLILVVDGRAAGFSRGVSIRELAEIMSAVGAVNALNLDGGGSSTMVVNGLVANRPSDGVERGVANALLVLPGADRAKSDLRVAGPVLRGALRGPADLDPASVGGLADSLLRQGIEVSPELRRTAAQFRSAR